jgi:ABC-type nitrate/sulfonate/bicarbonate transport system substrate-binding protein
VEQDCRSKLLRWGAVALGLVALTAGASAQQAPLKVIVFPGLSNLAILSAQHKGLFAKRNVSIELINTPNSTELRNGLAEGRYHIAHAAVDNAVAQIENNKVEASIVMGGDGGLNMLIVQPEINALEDLKGKTVVVDAPNTAYAFLLYKMLKVKGLERGKDYKVNPVGGTGQRLEAMKKDKANVGGMMNPPFSIRAVKQDGFKSLGSPAAVVGPYQAGGVWVLKAWAKANEDLLVRYLQANIEGIRWAVDPANTAEATRLLADRLKLDIDTAAASLAMGLDAKAGGFAKDLAFDMEGFKTVLALRAEMEGQWGGKPPAPDKFLDGSYYAKALAGLR